MKTDFCTIISSDYLCYAQALVSSLKKFNRNANLHVLIAEDELDLNYENISTKEDVRLYSPKELCHDGIGKKIYNKYFSSNIDHFRWCMKPVFLRYLMEKKKCEKVLYVDPDICFFGDYSFLFQKLETNNILLTPHWRNPDPGEDEVNFQKIFTEGYFNAGFVGVNNKSYPFLDWWAKVCLYACEKNLEKGWYDDQGYLNVVPIYFDKVEILEHKGCNVGDWSRSLLSRTARAGKVWIDGEWPLVFIHFTKGHIYGILKGQEPLFLPLLKEWKASLIEVNPDFEFSFLERPRQSTSSSPIHRMKKMAKKVLNKLE